MNKAIITAVMGLGMLYAQAVSASEMVRYEHGLFVADASSAQSATGSKPAKSAKSAKAASGNTSEAKPANVSKSTKHHGKKHHKHHAKGHHGHKHHHHHKHHTNKHHHKHHRHHHHTQPGCSHPAGCIESGMYAPRNASMAYGEPTLEQVEPNMDVLNRERAARSGRGR